MKTTPEDWNKRKIKFQGSKTKIDIKENTKEYLLKRLKNCKRNMQELWDSIKRPNFRIMIIEEGEYVQAKGIGNILKKKKKS
jgi:hypothetical protein